MTTRRFADLYVSTVLARCLEKPAHAHIEGPYRYVLGRTLRDVPLSEAGTSGVVLWVMLNPSKADGQTDDATLRVIRGFSTRWGFARLLVVNLFALRSTDPAALLADLPVSVGASNRAYQEAAIACADRIVCAWGAHPAVRRHDADGQFFRLAQRLNRPLDCLGRTRWGAPRHPLYMARETEPTPYRGWL